MDILKRCDTFLKLAQTKKHKEPSFDPEALNEELGGEQRLSPEDDDYSPNAFDYSDMPRSDVGSNYNYLTEPLPSLQDEEKDAFSNKLDAINDKYVNSLNILDNELNSITTNNQFAKNSKNKLVDILENIINILAEVSYGSVYKLPAEEFVSKIRDQIRSAQHIKHGLSQLIEEKRENGIDNTVSRLARLSDRLVILGTNILKDLNNALSASYKKRHSREDWRFDK